MGFNRVYRPFGGMGRGADMLLASGVSLGRNMFWAYWRKAHMFFVIIALIVFFAWKGAELPVWGMQAF